MAIIQLALSIEKGEGRLTDDVIRLHGIRLNKLQFLSNIGHDLELH